jgi:pantoate--beta-alanine ligase
MQTLTTIAELRERLAPLRGRRPVVLVPTMGALHDGHRACVDRARDVEGGVVVLSIFVNPLQFDDASDLGAYPRDLEADLAACESWGVDIVFAPGGEVMYPEPQATFVEVTDLTTPLEGRHRPGHFRGVTTVVAKLFGAVSPDVAVFGQKDAQQALVVRRMVRQLNMPIDIRLAPTVRESDGLAMSSRNARLGPDGRARAAAIVEALREAGERLRSGERDPRRIERAVHSLLEARGVRSLDYAEMRSAADLSPLERIEGRVILAVAARIASVRLIDNMVYEVAGKSVTVDMALF